jgi:hypothetical protein
MRLRVARISVALLAGCGSNSSNNGGDMGAVATCATMGMDVAAYSGDATGALALATPTVKMYAPDAVLSEIDGSNISLRGVTTGGAGGGAWMIRYYSSSLMHFLSGAFSGTSAHVGCQNTTVQQPPPVEPYPRLDSPDPLQTAISRVLVDTPNAGLANQSPSVTYGRVAIGSNPPHEGAWSITLQGNAATWVVVVDDASNTAVECTHNGVPCN